MRRFYHYAVHIFVFLHVYFIYAQGTLPEYKKSDALDSIFKNKVWNTPSKFHWVDGISFWYANNTEKGNEYIKVDARSKDKQVVLDDQKIAPLLSKHFKKNINDKDLILSDLRIDFQKNEVTFQFKQSNFKHLIGSNSIKIIDTVNSEVKNDKAYWGNRFDELGNPPVISPDSTMTSFIKNSNLYVKDNKSQEEFQLSYDGSKGFYYSSYIQWSPDSKKIMAYKIKPGVEHEIYFVESSPEDQLQPKLQSRTYPKPGDELPFKSPQLFIVGTKKHISVPTNSFSQQYSIANLTWRKDSRAFTFEFNQRGHQSYKILEVNAETGVAKTLINETSATFIDYSSKKFRYDIADGKEILWTSERDGWNHIYLYDGGTGNVIKQLTKGNWVVRDVLYVDEENQEIYFTASGMDPNQDPYFTHYCKIDFKGENFKRLTTENGNHKVFFSKDYKYYVDQYSRVDFPPITLLKAVENTNIILQLEKGDHDDLLKSGWIAPEVFTAKGRDGATDIWGIIVRPTTFDPNKNYPIIEYIYAGPHDSFVPKDFSAYYRSMSSLAELGFIVVQIDGMGTSNRSKSFHDVCWKNLKDAGFPDRKLWITEASKKYPYMNIDKVGIHGTSAGGQNAGAALVFNSDFYDVAVSSCGCHDNRMDKMWWNEQFMGYPIGPHYAASSNVEHAAQLKGNLMLILGELDDNVDPASTMQFVNALIKANKDFELVTIPGMGHSAGGDYGERKRKDFFVKHLLNVTPPSWDKVYSNNKDLK